MPPKQLIDETALLAAGYGKISTPFYKDARCGYQKEVLDPVTGQWRYLINLDLYDLPGMRVAVEVEARLYRDQTSFDVKLLLEPSHTVAHMERFYADTYNRMSCTPGGG